MKLTVSGVDWNLTEVGDWSVVLVAGNPQENGCPQHEDADHFPRVTVAPYPNKKKPKER